MICTWCTIAMLHPTPHMITLSGCSFWNDVTHHLYISKFFLSICFSSIDFAISDLFPFLHMMLTFFPFKSFAINSSFHLRVLSGISTEFFILCALHSSGVRTSRRIFSFIGFCVKYYSIYTNIFLDINSILSHRDMLY